MKKNQLDKDEFELIEAFDAGEFESNITPSRRLFIEDCATQAFKKNKRINIRLSGRDLIAIQKRALEEGIPYQTLVASIIHKYVSGSLYDATANKTMNLDG